MEVIGRAKQDARAESNAGAVAEREVCQRGTYFPAVAYTDVGKGREHDCMDAGGRTNQVEYRTYSVENVWS